MVFKLFAILQKYDFSSKSQLAATLPPPPPRCLRYCKSTIFQANHNAQRVTAVSIVVVCDTAKVRFFKQITTVAQMGQKPFRLFAILQKYDFSSKSQLRLVYPFRPCRCLRYCKSTIFQANHNLWLIFVSTAPLFAILQKYDFSSKSQPQATSRGQDMVVCDTAKVRFFKQITTIAKLYGKEERLFAILQKYDFSSKSQQFQHCSWR